ncbi:hypothetical protein ACWGCW_04265 [Streptomyces sp. NPDC054933]
MPADLFGDPVPKARRGSRKRPASDNDQRTTPQRIEDVARFADLYALGDVFHQSSGVGRHADYPPYVYLLFLACRGIYGSARDTAGHLQHPSVWNEIRKGIAEHLGAHRASLLPDIGPSRNHWLYAQRALLIPHLAELSDAYRHLALQQALSQGLLPRDAPRSWSRPQRHQLLAGDGTVAKAPTLATAPYSVNEQTGEVRRRRIDPAAALHAEGGDDKNLVRGTKFVVLSTRRPGYWRRVLLSYQHVPHNHPGGEAAVALEAANDLFDRPDTAGCMGLIYDGACRGVHRDAIARRGKLLINKQHSGIKPMHLKTLAFTRCRHELWTSGGRVAERVYLDDGTSSLEPVPITKFERRGTNTYRWYHLLAIPCPHGPHHHREPVGITTTNGERQSGHSDQERKFHRAEHLQLIPENTKIHDETFGGREDAESVFSQFDRHLWNGRLIAFGVEAQSLVMLGFMLAQNASSAARHREDPSPCGQEEV